MRYLTFILLVVFVCSGGCWSGTAGSVSNSSGGTKQVDRISSERLSDTRHVTMQKEGQQPQAGNTNPEVEKFNFPNFLPGSRIAIGKELLDEVNALASKEEQIQFLIATLPPEDQGKKPISDRQLYAIRLSSLTDSDTVIGPLMDRIDVRHKADGWPVIHAMARLGERSVEPLLKRMQDIASDRQKVTACNAALIEMKRNQYPSFLEELKQRKDIKLPNEIYEWLLEHYELIRENNDS